MADKFANEWALLGAQGADTLAAEEKEAELQKYEKRLIKRRVLLRMQQLTGHKSMMNAFAQWKDLTVLEMRKERARQLEDDNRKESERQREI